MKRPICIYCGISEGNTGDHVPPRCFFGGKPPSNAIVVPCCECCRRAGEKHETTLRNVFTSFETTENHPLAQAVLLGKRDRSFNYDHTEARKIRKMMVNVEVHSPGGIYLGLDMAIRLKNPTIDAFMERMSRALLYEEFQTPYFQGSFGWRLNPPIQEILRWLHSNASGKAQADVFYYRVFNAGSSAPFWVNMIFYQTLHFMVRVQRNSATRRSHENTDRPRSLFG